MAKATTEVNSAEIVGRSVTLEAGADILAGTIVAVKTSDGKAYPASDAAGLVVLGRAERTVPAGGQAEVLRGTFLWENSASSRITYPGQTCHVADDQTVQAATGTNSVVAGVCAGFADGKVAVRII